MPVPVIAAIHGNCFGGGLQIALAADIRFATPDARLSVMEIKWGLIPDMSITRTLPRLVGHRRRQGADLHRPHRHRERGRAARGSSLTSTTIRSPRRRSSPREIAGKSPDAVRGAKRLFDEAWNGSPEQTLALEASIQLGLVGSPNQLAAVSAGISGQPAEFVDAHQ